MWTVFPLVDLLHAHRVGIKAHLGTTSDTRLFSGEKRTSHFKRVKSVRDPEADIAPNGSRTLLHNRITIGGQVQKNSLGDVCALIWCYPFIVRVRTTVALRIFNERTVDGTDNQVFNCGRRHLTSQSLAHE